MSRLFVFGDSFSQPYSNPLVWTQSTANRLSLELHNHSLQGTSQTYSWQLLQSLIGLLTATDRVIIVMTHPSRTWFFKQLPAVSNINIANIDQVLTLEQQKAIELYVRYIQRPEIDCQQVDQRLAWLCWQFTQRGLAKPLVIMAFPQNVTDPTVIEGLDLAKGTLYDIQMAELAIDPQQVNQLWLGQDARYNHLVLDNHERLARKIVHYFQHGGELDLTQGFVQNIIDIESLTDPLFEAQFDPERLSLCRQAHAQGSRYTSWKQRLGLNSLGG